MARRQQRPAIRKRQKRRTSALWIWSTCLYREEVSSAICSLQIPHNRELTVVLYSLAFAEMRLIIARMAYNFDITLVEDSKRWMEDMRILQVWAEPPLNLYLKPRNI